MFRRNRDAGIYHAQSSSINSGDEALKQTEIRIKYQSQ